MRIRPGERLRAVRTTINGYPVVRLERIDVPDSVLAVRGLARARLENLGAEGDLRRLLEAFVEGREDDRFIKNYHGGDVVIWLLRAGRLRVICGALDANDARYWGRLAQSLGLRWFHFDYRGPKLQLRRPTTEWSGKRRRDRWPAVLRVEPGSTLRIREAAPANE